MTPIGHASLSCITGKSFRIISLPAIILGGMSPDFDFLFLFFDWFNQIHRIVSHNFIYIILASLISTFFAEKGRRCIVGLSFLSGGLLHLLFDSFMDNNPTNGIGIALMWPISDKVISPFNILPPALQSPGWNNPLKMIASLVPVILFELPFYAAALFLLFKKRKHPAASSHSRP